MLQSVSTVVVLFKFFASRSLIFLNELHEWQECEAARCKVFVKSVFLQSHIITLIGGKGGTFLIPSQLLTLRGWVVLHSHAVSL